MKHYKLPERRTCQRFPLQLPLKLFIPDSSSGNHVDATAINMCINGIYCTVNRYLSVFDKLLVTLVNPAHDRIPPHVISEIEGVVVRVEPEQPEEQRNTYNIALYFSKVTEQQQQALYEFMFHHTGQN